ncbi:carboxypeptidase regulatory-like domain-containing protein [bacterium]|nr:carboxypeptidase regulatory-like domain-containing protein [candidate division CSSED10-310 bacterium]
MALRIFRHQHLLVLLLITTPIFWQSIVFSTSAYISGAVFDADSIDPVSEIRIRIYDSQWEYVSAASTTCDPDGTYVTGSLEPGRYYLRAVSIYPQNYVAEYWPESYEKEAAVPILVEDGVTVVGTNFYLIRGGYILGTITNQSATALPDLDIDIYDENWSWVRWVSDYTDTDGDYIIGPVLQGKYYVRADPSLDHGVQQQYWPNAYYRDDAVYIAVYPEDIIQGINFSLPPGSIISGSVMNIFDEPVAQCEIIVFSTDGREQPVHQAVSDAKGSYIAYGLPAGSYYLQACAPNGCGFESRFYPSETSMATAQTVAVTPDTMAESIDFILPEGNFDLSVMLTMPKTHVVPGDPFSLTLSIANDGTHLDDLPLFILLQCFGSYYFWPSWQPFNPPDYPYIDYAFMDLDKGNREIVVFPQFTWPHTGIAADNLQFISAFVTWSVSDLASDPAFISWSFE